MNYLRPGDALLVVDVQNDFLPGGTLAVPNSQEVITALRRYLDVFVEASAPVFATRDWHPANHCSFHAQEDRGQHIASHRPTVPNFPHHSTCRLRPSSSPKVPTPQAKPIPDSKARRCMIISRPPALPDCSSEAWRRTIASFTP